MLIDTILRQYPIPKVYLRTKVNVLTQRAVREIVDGQQRVRAILDFAEDKFALTKRAQEFKGMRYSNLTEEQKATFLTYPISVDQLVNAGDEEVLEVFGGWQVLRFPSDLFRGLGLGAPSLRAQQGWDLFLILLRLPRDWPAAFITSPTLTF